MHELDKSWYPEWSANATFPRFHTCGPGLGREGGSTRRRSRRPDLADEARCQLSHDRQPRVEASTTPIPSDIPGYA